jgi:hypothetical protein
MKPASQKFNALWLSVAVVVSAVGTGVQYNWAMYSSARQEREGQAIYILCRGVSDFVIKNRKMPDSWESLVTLASREQNLSAAEWTEQTRSARPLIRIAYDVELCDNGKPSVLDWRSILSATEVRGWRNLSSRRWIIERFAKDIRKDLESACGPCDEEFMQ